MGIIDLYPHLWAGIKKGFDSDRLAHAYVIVGSPRGDALKFAEAFLKLLFCEGAEPPCNECNRCRKVETHKHVDTLWMEPTSKARQIKAEEMRELVHRMMQTSFEGGWKAGVLVSAECMNTTSANILLKTLEEPPPKTILLLITDSPQALLPTILSRCQRIVLSDGKDNSTESIWYNPLIALLHELPSRSGLSAARLASQLKAIYDTVKAEISDAVMEDLGESDEMLDESKLKVIIDARINARLKEVQAEMFRIILDWHRDILMLVSGVDSAHLIFSEDRVLLEKQAQHHTQTSALKATQVVEGMATRLARNIPPAQIFDEAFRKLVRL